MKKMLISTLFIGFLSTSLYVQGDSGCLDSLKNTWNKQSGPIKALIVGTPVIAVGGIALLYRLIMHEESSEKIYAKARLLYEEICQKYGRMELLHVKHLTKSMTEPELALLTTHEEIKLLPHVQDDIGRLKGMKERLQMRIHRDTHKGSSVLHEMNVLMRDTKRLIDELERLAKFWHRHGSYFTAYNTVNDLARKYQQARQDVNNKDLVKRAIMSIAIGGGASYPYLSFADTLKRNVDRMVHCIESARPYAGLYNSVQALHVELSSLLGTVASLDEYANELHLKKQHQLAQQRIDAEREKADAERAKANAMEQQAAAERAKVSAMYQQAAAERQKARAIEEQTLVQLAKPTPQVNINLQPPAQATFTVIKPVASRHVQTKEEYDPLPETYTPPEPSAPPLEPYLEPLPQLTMQFFEKIQNLSPPALEYLGVLIPQLEEEYRLARDAILGDKTLISAAIQARKLDPINKAILIRWLKNYGVKPLAGDFRDARASGEKIIMNAVSE